MDQNRCLLDVIDNPQLLQSFLESESSAETSGGDSQQPSSSDADRPTAAAEAAATTTTAPSTTTNSLDNTNPQQITEQSQQQNSTTIDSGNSTSGEHTTSLLQVPDRESSPVIDSLHNSYFGFSNPTDFNNPNADPVVSVLDSIITETVAETSPSTRQQNDTEITPESIATAATTTDIPDFTTPATSTQIRDDTNTTNIPTCSTIDVPTSSPPAITTTTATNETSTAIDQSLVLNSGTPTTTTTSSDTSTFLISNDTNNNSTSSSEDGSSNLLVDEFYSQQNLNQKIFTDNDHQKHVPLGQPMQTLQPEIEPSTKTTTPTTTTPTTTTTSIAIDKSPASSQTNSSIDTDSKTETNDSGSQPPCPTKQDPQEPQQLPNTDSQTQQQVQQPIEQSQPQPQQPQNVQLTKQQQDNDDLARRLLGPPRPGDIKPSASTTKPTPTKTTKNNNSPANKTQDSKPKRNTARSKKNAKTPAAPTTTPQSPVVSTNQIRPMQTQFMTTSPAQQQIIFQANNGIRQPAMMAQSPMCQPMTGVPQQQRVIQIQTANGPMYFAIAPGPAATGNNNNNMVNQQQGQQQSQQQQQQQQQQPGIQSQYPSQQICFQPNSTVMLNRPQLNQPMMQHQSSPQQQQNQQQQQSQQTDQHLSQMQSQQQQNLMGGGNILNNGPTMIQSPHQAKISSPMMTGQTIAIQNQQNPQQQHVVLPSSQSMMMPRMPNQLIVNRPMGTTGQLLPGQQQFIQILTPNGPMLLALPTQQAQPMNNTVVDYNNQSQMNRQPMLMQQHHQIQQQPQQVALQPKPIDSPDSARTGAQTKQSNSSKNAAQSKSGLDLADLLLDCGILPDDRAGSQSSSSVKSSHSPSLSQISSPMPNMSQINSPMPTSESSTLPQNHTPQPVQNYNPNQSAMQQQPVRITFAPDGQMIMQPAVYGAIRPVLAQSQVSSVAPTNIIPSSPMMTMTSISSPSTPIANSQTSTTDSTKKTNAKGRGTAVKRSRSKKSDIDNFPQLKTPKIAQQQQQQQQQQMQAVTVVPMTVLVGDQNKVLAAGSDIKPNVAQLASGQQVSVAKFVSPVMQSAPLQSAVSSNMMQTSLSSNLIGTQAATIGQNQTHVVNSGQLLNTQRVPDSGNSISASSIQQPQQQQLQLQQQQDPTTMGAAITTLANSQLSSSGNVTTKLLKRDDKSGTVESNPHISSSLMPTLSLTVDTLKIEQNGLKQIDLKTPGIQTIKGIQFQNASGTTTTLVLKPATLAQQQQIQQQQQQQLQQQQQQQQQQQLARQIDLRVQSILNQLKADQNAAISPQTKLAFNSIEDACKRLLRYHVFDTDTISQANLKKVDQIFEAAVESLITRKQAIYDKFRILILKQSMRTVPSGEEVMLEQIFVNEELAFLKKERELFREYEAHLESVALNQAKADSVLDSSKNECAPDYFAFGNNSPKQKHRDGPDNAAHSRDVDEWLLTDKWGESRFPSVPDSEAATAIESILNEEIS